MSTVNTDSILQSNLPITHFLPIKPNEESRMVKNKEARVRQAGPNRCP